MKLTIYVEMVWDFPKEDQHMLRAPAKELPSGTLLKIKLGIWYLEQSIKAVMMGSKTLLDILNLFESFDFFFS